MQCCWQIVTDVLEEIDASISYGRPRNLSVSLITLKKEAVGLSEMSVTL